MSNPQLVIQDVHMVLRTARDFITVATTVEACLSAGAHHTDYDDRWRRSFDEKADALVRVIAEELGGGWTDLPPDTLLGPKAQEAFRAVCKLLPH